MPTTIVIDEGNSEGSSEWDSSTEEEDRTYNRRIRASTTASEASSEAVVAGLNTAAVGRLKADLEQIRYADPGDTDKIGLDCPVCHCDIGEKGAVLCDAGNAREFIICHDCLTRMFKSRRYNNLFTQSMFIESVQKGVGYCKMKARREHNVNQLEKKVAKTKVILDGVLAEHTEEKKNWKRETKKFEEFEKTMKKEITQLKKNVAKKHNKLAEMEKKIAAADETKKKVAVDETKKNVASVESATEKTTTINQCITLNFPVQHNCYNTGSTYNHNIINFGNMHNQQVGRAAYFQNYMMQPNYQPHSYQNPPSYHGCFQQSQVCQPQVSQPLSHQPGLRLQPRVRKRLPDSFPDSFVLPKQIKQNRLGCLKCLSPKCPASKNPRHGKCQGPPKEETNQD